MINLYQAWTKSLIPISTLATIGSFLSFALFIVTLAFVKKKKVKSIFRRNIFVPIMSFMIFLLLAIKFGIALFPAIPRVIRHTVMGSIFWLAFLPYASAGAGFYSKYIFGAIKKIFEEFTKVLK